MLAIRSEQIDSIEFSICDRPARTGNIAGSVPAASAALRLGWVGAVLHPPNASNAMHATKTVLIITVPKKGFAHLGYNCHCLRHRLQIPV